MARRQSSGRSQGRDAGRPSGKQARAHQTPHQQRNAKQLRSSKRAAAQRGNNPHAQRREARELDLIEGRRAVAEALDAGLPIRRALVQSGAESDQAVAGLVARLERAGAAVEEVPRSLLDRLSSHGAHQGIIVEAQPFAYASVADVVARAGEGSALVVALDHVTDEGNFGAIVRSAEVVGASGVIIANARAARVGVGAYKTSAGAVFNIPIAQVANLAKALDELKSSGFWVAGATEHAERSVWESPLEGRVALVMGSEGSGISRLVREKCDFLCKLPQRGVTESLNVAQATTVMAYEWLRRECATPVPQPPNPQWVPAVSPTGPTSASVPFGDDFDLGGDRVNADLPPAGAPSATGMFRAVHTTSWNADDLDIGGDPL